MNRTSLAALTRVAVVVSLPLLPMACNDNKDIPPDAFRITPASAHLAKDGDFVVLEAVGGLEPFTWSLSVAVNTTATSGTTTTSYPMGTLSGSGRTVTFTRGAAAGANTVQVMDNRTWTASATIYLDPATSSVSSTSLAISPAQATLSDNRDTVVFLATGGTQPFTWTLADAYLGHLSANSGNQVVYTRDRPGDNTVILTDASNAVKTATVAQPDSTAALSISPASATLANNGDTVVFLAVGGTSPFTWTVADSTRGHLSDNDGDSVVYTRDAEGNNSVVLTDRYGNTVVAAIAQSSAGTALSVTPTSANIDTDGDVVVFVASGGTEPYHWSVAIPARGTLDSTRGTSVIYTRTTIGNNTVQLTDGDGTTIAVQITQSDSTPALSVAPSSASLTANGEVVVLVASGGLPPYNWSVVTPPRGTVSAATGTSITYTRTTAGNNTVQLTDANGNIITIPITQNDSTPALTVTPTSANLAADGEVAVLVASGGVPPYNWTVTVPARGSLSAATGASITYTRTTVGNNTVQLTDANGSIKTVSITQPDSSSALVISPTSGNLAANGDATVFAASGGTPPYTWSLAIGARGTLSAATGTPVTYTRTAAGNNTIVLTDSAGRLVTAGIVQSAPNQLSATASPGSLTTNGALSVITVSGGLPPYTWTLVNGNGVILSTAAQGVSGIYQRSAAGDNAIVIRDATSIQVSVVISQP